MLTILLTGYIRNCQGNLIEAPKLCHYFYIVFYDLNMSYYQFCI